MKITVELDEDSLTGDGELAPAVYTMLKDATRLLHCYKTEGKSKQGGIKIDIGPEFLIRGKSKTLDIDLEYELRERINNLNEEDAKEHLPNILESLQRCIAMTERAIKKLQ